MAKRSKKLTFPGAQGAELAARLDLPPMPVRAYALFAHCFTCSKDIFAASRVAGELAARGFAVLRFDFTGLGASDGEFANTNFSSNVGDLLSAVDYLRTHYKAPEILIGHSLGGAAVLAAAKDVPEARAVATIGAPADAAHVVHNFGAKIDEIEKNGTAEVKLAGRSFTIKKQFLDDLDKVSIKTRIADMDKALLLFHAPLDSVVGIDNAAQIYNAAKHPKSFISLDDANHLLSRKQDAIYVAEVLASWATRYVSQPPPSGLQLPGEEGVASVAETGQGKFQNETVVEGHRLLVDEPVEVGGLDSGPSPYDLLSLSLAGCTSMTLRMYADHKGIKVEQIKVHVSHDKIHAQDCAACGTEHVGKDGRIDLFKRKIEILGVSDEKVLARMIQIADKCPVHRTLEKVSHIKTELQQPAKSAAE